MLLRVTSSKNEKTKSSVRSRSKSLYSNYIYNFELFEQNVGMLNFVILGIDLALNRDCLRSWNYSINVFAIAFFERRFCY